MKTIIVNASPRKNWNTALMLKEAQKGAESVGAETEYVDLYDLNFAGCHSCLACKRKSAEKSKCYWQDDLSPWIETILQADSVIIGAPLVNQQLISVLCLSVCASAYCLMTAAEAILTAVSMSVLSIP